MVKVPPAHSRAQVAGRFFYREHAFEYVRGEHLDWYVKFARVGFDKSKVLRRVAGVHYEKDELEGEFVVALQFLKQLRH